MTQPHSPHEADALGVSDDDYLKALEHIYAPGFLSPGQVPDLNLAFEGLDVRQSTIVDFGCGLGGYSTELLRQGAGNVIGLDADPTMVDRTLQRAADMGMSDPLTAHHVTPEAPLPIADGSVDYVLVKYVWLYLPHDQRLTTLHEFFRILKPGGTLVMDEIFQGSAPRDDVLEAYLEQEATFMPLDLRTVEEIVAQMEKVGFSCTWRDTSENNYNVTMEEVARLRAPNAREKMTERMFTVLEEMVLTAADMLTSKRIAAAVIHATR